MAKKKRIKVKEVAERKSFLELKRERELQEQEEQAKQTQQETDSNPCESITDKPKEVEPEPTNEVSDTSTEVEPEPTNEEPEPITEEPVYEEPVIEEPEPITEEPVTTESIYSMGTGSTNYSVMDDDGEDDDFVKAGVPIGHLMEDGYIDLDGNGVGDAESHVSNNTYAIKTDDTVKTLGEHISDSSNILNGDNLYGDGFDDMYKGKPHKPLTEIDDMDVEDKVGTFKGDVTDTLTEQEEPDIEEQVEPDIEDVSELPEIGEQVEPDTKDVSELTEIEEHEDPDIEEKEEPAIEEVSELPEIEEQEEPTIEEVSELPEVEEQEEPEIEEVSELPEVEEQEEPEIEEVSELPEVEEQEEPEIEEESELPEIEEQEEPEIEEVSELPEIEEQGDPDIEDDSANKQGETNTEESQDNVTVDESVFDIALPKVKYHDMEMYKALLAYSEGGMLGDEPADLRGITHIDISVFDEMYGVSQDVLIGTDNTETIELPYEGRYIGVRDVKGVSINPLRTSIKTTYYVSYTGNFYTATNDLKNGHRVNLAGEYVTPVEPEEGVEAIIYQTEHKDGVTFEYKVKDLTGINKRLGLKTLTPIKESKKGKIFGWGKSKTGSQNMGKNKQVKNKQKFFSKKSKGEEEGSMGGDKPIKGKPVNGKPVNGKPVNGKAVQGKPVKGKPVKGKPVKGKPVKGKPVKGKPVKGKPVKGNKPYSRYSEEKPTLWNKLTPLTRAFIMGFGFLIVIFAIGSRLLAPSNTIDYVAFNESETLLEVAEDSFGKSYVNTMENQAFIYFEPRHKEVKVSFLEYLETYMNTGDESIKKDLDTITLQYFANLEFVQKQALNKYQNNKQRGDTSDLTLNFEKNNEKLQEVIGGSLKDYTGRVMNGYADTQTLRNLIGVDTNQEVGAFLNTFTDNIFYVYYNYVTNQVDPLLAGVTDERDEVDAEGATVEQWTITTEGEETEEVTQ